MLTHLRFITCWCILFSLLTLLSGCSEEAAAGIFVGGAAVWIIGSIILFLLVVWALLDLWKKPYDTSKKLLWLLIILIIPYIGAILYFLVGRNGREAV